MSRHVDPICLGWAASFSIPAVRLINRLLRPFCRFSSQTTMAGVAAVWLASVGSFNGVAPQSRTQVG